MLEWQCWAHEADRAAQLLPFAAIEREDCKFGSLTFGSLMQLTHSTNTTRICTGAFR